MRPATISRRVAPLAARRATHSGGRVRHDLEEGGVDQRLGGVFAEELRQHPAGRLAGAVGGADLERVDQGSVAEGADLDDHLARIGLAGLAGSQDERPKGVLRRLLRGVAAL
jgi:hypothetical protein